MKAKEYFAKYEERLHSNDEKSIGSALSDMLMEMNDESQSLINARKARTNHALVGILNECNNKWNAVVSLDEKKYSQSIIKYNGFKLFWLNQMPELKMIWK